MNPILAKQLAKLGIDPELSPEPEVWSRLLCKLNQTYDAWDRDRYLLEQAMEVSSQELRELMEVVQARNELLQAEVQEHAQTAERLHYNATHDLLTGLSSRQMLLEMIGQCLLRVRDQPSPEYAALFIDLDSFKPINDTLGHEVGDEVLIEVADRLRYVCLDYRPNKPHIARIGGDEFVVLLGELRSRDTSAHCAQALCRRLALPIDVRGGHRVSVGASIGIAFGDAAHESANDVLRDADIAMYRAKSLGKGRHALFDREMHQSIVRRLATEQSLRESIDEDRFDPYYQPKVCLSTGDITGFEALVRWRHPTEGVLAPNAFLEIANETGLIVPIGEAVLRRICRDLRRWIEQAPKATRNISVAVNLNRRQLMMPDAIPRLLRLLGEERIDPSRIIVELTEHSVATDTRRIVGVMNTLRQAGVKIHMDDFGTGESSLAALHHLPLDAVKLDRQFISRSRGNRELTAVVAAVVTLAHNLGLTAIGEGIERLDQIAQLQACECDQGQGFFFARPLPADEALDHLLNQVRRWQFQNQHRAA